MAKGPGNYGWPYCRANPNVIQKPGSVTSAFCYTQYNYSGSGTAGAMYNPTALRNTSKNNTGIVNLPPMKPAQVWYPYDASGTAFPIFGTCGSNCNTGMVGPVYNHNAAQGSARLPSVFDRHVFIIEWVRDRIFVAPLDSAGNVGALRQFKSGRDSVTNGPMEMKVGPDGALYFLNWANSGTSGYNYPNNNGTGTLTRLAYTGAHVGLGGVAAQARHGAGRADRLFAAVPGASFVWPHGVTRADFYALTGQKLWTAQRLESSAATEVALPAQVRGVVRLRLR
jgi:hypothetical protein